MRSFVAVLLAALMVALSFVPTYDIFFHYSVDENCSRCGRLNYGTVKREMYLYSYDDGRHVYEKVIDMFAPIAAATSMNQPVGWKSTGFIP